MKTQRMVAAGTALAALLAAALGHSAILDWLSVDSGYDSGGVYLDEIDKCSRSQAEIDQHRRR